MSAKRKRKLEQIDDQQNEITAYTMLNPNKKHKNDQQNVLDLNGIENFNIHPKRYGKQSGNDNIYIEIGSEGEDVKLMMENDDNNDENNVNDGLEQCKDIRICL